MKTVKNSTLKATKQGFLAAFLIGLSLSCSGQNSSIWQLVDSFSSESKVQLVDCSSFTSYAKDYEVYEALRKSANYTDLIKLTKHKKNNIRAYSFVILSEKDSLNMFPILIKDLVS